MFENFTGRAIYSVRQAEEEARKLGQNCVGTGMLLLGILEEGGTASRILAEFGMTLDVAREEVLALIAHSSKAVGVDHPFTENAKRTFELAQSEAESLVIKDVGVLHVLHGLLDGKDTVAIRVFDLMGVNREDVRKRVSDELNKSFGPRA